MTYLLWLRGLITMSKSPQAELNLFTLKLYNDLVIRHWSSLYYIDAIWVGPFYHFDSEV
jgi:hypothetical protein